MKTFNLKTISSTLRQLPLLVGAVVLFGSMLLTSCVKERFWSDTPFFGKGEKEILIKINAPGNFASALTRSLSGTQEKAIAENDIIVLLFDKDGKFVTRKQATNLSYGGAVDCSFTVSLTASASPTDTYNIVILANSEFILGTNYDYTSLVDKSYAEVAAMFNSSISTAMFPDDTDYIPMWGETGNIEISLDASLNPINLHRAVARIDVGVGTTSAGDKSNLVWINDAGIPFSLDEVIIYRANNKYSVIPDAANFNSKATAPTIPSSTTKFSYDDSRSKFTYNDITNGLYTTRSIYVPESDIMMSSESGTESDKHKNRMAIVVGGRYDGNAKSYYRLDFKVANDVNPKQKDFINVLRNHLYQFNIVSVKGDGYKTPDQAYEAASFNMTSNVVEWNETDIGDIEFDGTSYFSITDRKVEFTPFGGQTTTVTIRTNVTNFEMFELDRGGRTQEMKANGTGTELTFGPHEKGYEYALSRVGSTDVYKLVINSTKHNVSNAVPDRKERWEIVANRMNIPFEVDQQWTRLYISVVNGQSTRLYPEGTAGTVIPIDIMALVPVTVTSSQDWVQGVNNVNTSSGGLYMANLKLEVKPFKFGNGADEDGTDNRTATITITAKGEDAIVYTITQEKPYITFSRTNEYISRPVAPAIISSSVDVLTNVLTSDLTLERIAEGSTGSDRITLDGGMTSPDAIRPRYKRFTVNANLQNWPLPDNSFNATFAVSPKVDIGNKYGSLMGASVNVVVPSNGEKFTPYWFRSRFGTPEWQWAPTQYSTTIGNTSVTDNMIFPWNATEVQFEILSNAGALFDKNKSTTGVDLQLTESNDYLNGSETYIPYTFTFNNSNYNEVNNYVLTFTADGTKYSGRTDKAVINFRQGVQYWDRTPMPNNAFIGYKGQPEATPAAITVTNNTLWSYYVSGWSPAVPTDWVKVRIGTSGNFAVPISGSPAIQDDRLSAPVPYTKPYTGTQFDGGLTKATTFQVAVDRAAGPIANSSSDVIRRTAAVNFVNNSLDATKNGANISSPTITVKQYAPRIYFTNGSIAGVANSLADEAKIHHNGGNVVVNVSTNLAQWGVKVFQGTDNSTTAVKTVDNVTVTNDREGVASSVTITFDGTYQGKNLAFYLYSTQQGLTNADNAANEIKIAQVTQSISPSGKADILYLGSDGKLACSKVTDADYSRTRMLFFKFGSVVGFTNNDDAWNANATASGGSVRFNPVTPGAGLAYASIPVYVNGNATVGDEGAISASGYHNLSNVKAGKGDPCKLVGLTAQQVKDMTQTDFDNYKSGWRLPKSTEQADYCGLTEAGIGPYADSSYPYYANSSGTKTSTVGTTASPARGYFPIGGTNGTGTADRSFNSSAPYLPAAGSRDTTGAAGNVGAGGLYWSGTVNSANSGYTLFFSDLYVYPRLNSSYAVGFGVRCVPQ